MPSVSQSSLEGLGLGGVFRAGIPLPCPGWKAQRARPMEPSPVHKVEVLLQEARVHGALAELQLCLGVVVHVVDAHLLQDPEAPLQDGEDARQHWRVSVTPDAAVQPLWVFSAFTHARVHPLIARGQIVF